MTAKRNKTMNKTGQRRLGSFAKMAAAPGAFRNHPQWYENYPLDHLMGINFGQREAIGLTIPANVAGSLHDIQSAPDSRYVLDLTIPAKSTAFMESMQILMNKLRAASGSNITYTIYDLAAYVLNAREIYARYSQDRRTILAARIADIYDQDAHIKYALLSNGRGTATITDITANLASDTTRLNRLAKVISAMIPIRMSLFERTAWLFSNIFADAHTAKFSAKMFCPRDMTTWVADNNNGDVHTTTNNQHAVKLTDSITDLETMVGAFTASVENSRIAGDLLKAFGSFFTTLQTVDETTKLVPIYDEAALTQIQNASIFPMVDPNGSIYIAASASTTTVQYTTPYAAGPCAYLSSSAGRHVLNTYKDACTPGELVSLTRLAGEVEVTLQADNSNLADVIACGTEILIQLDWTYSISGGVISYITFTPPFNTSGTQTHLISNHYDVITAWARDDWSPLIVPMVHHAANDISAPDLIMTMFDLSNWASIDANNLMIFHQAAMLSLTATPASLIEQSSFKFLV